MGESRFSDVDGLPVRALRAKAAPPGEVKQVRLLRARWKQAKDVALRRRHKTNENRRMLAGYIEEYVGAATPSSVPVGTTATSGLPQAGTADIIPTNLFLRATLQAKSEACDETWTTRCHGVGDLPPEVSDAIVDDAETLVEKVIALAGVTREFSDSIDDSATIGPMMVKYGIGRVVVNRKAASGGAQSIADIVNAAASGDVNVHPLDGMDYPALSKALRDFVTPEQAAIRTKDQLDNIERVAQESDAKWVDAIDAKPEGYESGDIWARRVVFGDDVLWDPTVTTRWDDASWMGFLIRMPLSRAQKIEEWKPSARSQLVPVSVSKADGWQVVTDPSLPTEALDTLNKIFEAVEWWDKETGQVHYFTPEATGYDGFLERDPVYPHFDDKMRSILKSWFPVAVAVPVMHNLPLPERTQGIGWLEPGRPHAKQYVLADSALTASRKKAGRVMEVPSDLPADARNALLGGEDLALIPRPAEMEEGKSIVKIHDFGQAPVDLVMMKNDALKAFSASVGLTLLEATGEASSPTLGQDVMASRGPQARRGGLVRKMQSMAGDLAQDFAAMIRRYYSVDKVTELMGREFTTATPYMVPDPSGAVDPATGSPAKIQPKDPVTGQPAMIPSKWDIWRNASTPWDQWEVVFNPSAQGQDLMRAKALSDFATMVQGFLDPITHVPYFDPRPLLEHQSKAMGFGRLRKFPVTPEQLAALLGIGAGGPAGPGGQPGSGGPGPEGGERDRSTPNGGNETSRNAGGARGPQPVPHRQDRNEGMRDDGDQSMRAHRMGMA